MTNLKGSDAFENTIIKYLNENASEELTKKINKCKATIKDCCNYIKSEAKKLAVSGCAMVEDKQVYGWAVHFYEEGGINVSKVEASVKPNDTTVKTVSVNDLKQKYEKEQEKKEKKEKKGAEIAGQMSLFDLL